MNFNFFELLRKNHEGLFSSVYKGVLSKLFKIIKYIRQVFKVFNKVANKCINTGTNASRTSPVHKIVDIKYVKVVC